MRKRPTAERQLNRMLEELLRAVIAMNPRQRLALLRRVNRCNQTNCWYVAFHMKNALAWLINDVREIHLHNVRHAPKPTRKGKGK